MISFGQTLNKALHTCSSSLLCKLAAMSTCVPCVCWVAKAKAKEVPDKVELSEEDVKQLLQEAQEQLQDLGLGPSTEDASSEEKVEAMATEKGRGKRKTKKTKQVSESKEDDEVDKLYDLDNYDSEEEEAGQKVSGAGMGDNLAGLTYYATNDEDPYITLKNVSPDDEEEDDYRVLPTDNLLVIGRAEEEFSSIEVHVYSESEQHSYCHHEVLLSSFPLALEWLDFDPEQPDKRGNYLAVGTMSPLVEIWDLDVVDGLEPVFTLGDPAHVLPGGGANITKKKSKKKKPKDKTKSEPSQPADGHSDAVLDLSWNRIVRNILASASADCSVCVWDMAWPKCVLTLPHPDKVQCVQWHPYQPELLVTGGYDSNVRLFNCKSPEAVLRTWSVDGEIERLLWNHLVPHQLLVSTGAKTVWCFNKDDGATLFQIHAHTDSITDISLSCHVPGLLATAGGDDTVKFWDIQDNKPVFLLSKDMHMGSVLCAKFCVDSPYSLAVGGEKNGFHLLHVANMSAVTQRFKDRDLIVPVTSPQQSLDSTLGGSELAADRSNGVDESSDMEIDESQEEAIGLSLLKDSVKKQTDKSGRTDSKVSSRSKKVVGPKKKRKEKKYKH